MPGLRHAPTRASWHGSPAATHKEHGAGGAGSGRTANNLNIRLHGNHFKRKRKVARQFVCVPLNPKAKSSAPVHPNLTSRTTLEQSCGKAHVEGHPRTTGPLPSHRLPRSGAPLPPPWFAGASFLFGTYHAGSPPGRYIPRTVVPPCGPFDSVRAGATPGDVHV